MLDAAALAAILDPKRKVPGWWKLAPTKCGNGSRDGVVDIFTGQPDLHTARALCNAGVAAEMAKEAQG